MINQVDSTQSNLMKEHIQVLDDSNRAQYYQELNQSLAEIKNNLSDCIQGLDNTLQIKPSLLLSIKKMMRDIERAKEVISTMKQF